MIKETKNEKIMLAFGVLLRVICFVAGLFIGGNYIDEAMTGLNAAHLADNMTDAFGRDLPVYFDTWVIGGQSPMATYLSSLTVKIFGLNYFGIRLPMLIFSILGFFAFYGLGKELFKDEKLRLVCLAFSCISPWMVFTSSFVLDCNYIAHFLVIASFFLLKAVNSNKTGYYVLSMIFFGLSFYCYMSSVLIVPVFLLVFYIGLLAKKRIKISQVIISVLTITVVSLVFILFGLVTIGVIPEFELFGLHFYEMKEYCRANSLSFVSAENAYALLIATIYNPIKSFSLLFGGLLVNNHSGINVFGFANILGGLFLFIAIVKLGFSVRKKNKEYSFLTKLFCLTSFITLFGYCTVVCAPLDVTYYRYSIFTYFLVVFESIGFVEVLKFFKRFNVKRIASVYFGISLAVLVFMYGFSYVPEMKNSSFCVFGDNIYKCFEYYDNSDYDSICFYVDDIDSKIIEERISTCARYYYYGKDDVKFSDMQEEFVERNKDVNKSVQCTQDGTILLKRVEDCNKPTEDLIAYDVASSKDIELSNQYKTFEIGSWIIAYK